MLIVHAQSTFVIRSSSDLQQLRYRPCRAGNSATVISHVLAPSTVETISHRRRTEKFVTRTVNVEIIIISPYCASDHEYLFRFGRNNEVTRLLLLLLLVFWYDQPPRRFGCWKKFGYSRRLAFSVSIIDDVFLTMSYQMRKFKNWRFLKNFRINILSIDSIEHL